jgi:aryl-alcohol dehydrogenase-like predicted oxidoreductase
LEYSPFALDIESPEIGLLKACRELGVAVVAYSPLGRGFLQLKSRSELSEGDWRLSLPRFTEENFPKNLALVEKIKTVAAEVGCTPGQVCLAWLVHQGNDIIPIPGTKNQKYLDENIKAAHVKLSAKQLEALRKAAEESAPVGERYAPSTEMAMFGDSPPKKETKSKRMQ